MSVGKWKLVVKDGDYGFDQKSGQYGAHDFVLETEDAVEALREFLNYAEVGDDDEDVKATLTFRHKAH